MTHPHIAWTIFALWLGAAVVYLKGHRIDFIKKRQRIWWLCAIPMVAPVFVLAILALFIKGAIDFIFRPSGPAPKTANSKSVAPARA
jgi:hypothetical protein